MARPKKSELTDRELAVMRVFWESPDEELTAEQARELLETSGEKIAYVTVANVVRGLVEKQFLNQVNPQRPYRFTAIKSFESVSNKLVGDLIKRVFGGSREAMLVQLLDRRRLSKAERVYLQQILEDAED